MSRKTIAAVVLGVALLVGSMATGAGAAGPYDQGPSVRMIGKSKVKKGAARLAVATCGTGTCSIPNKTAVIKVAGFKMRGKFTKPSSQPFGAGQQKTVKLVVSKKLKKIIDFGYKVAVKTNLTVQSDNGLNAVGNGKTKIKG